MPKVISTRLAAEPIPAQSTIRPKSCLLNHQTNQVCRLKCQKEGSCTLDSPRTLESSNMIELQNVLFRVTTFEQNLGSFFRYKQ
ncbi:unnamed protein product [Hymenolepis diminuta]|uniref:Uncharacterized protein n=1 Tax=Hymenolepis diminuta TaxID=6216 RepID=A0A564YZM4_HYMDI|nr:unnamed protein product [Hymenolepis diminuta]